MSKKIQKAENCPNCEQPLSGQNFCPNCGQKNDVRRLFFWDFVKESLANFFAFDGRVFHTLYLLFRKPGQVAKEYVQNRRVKFTNPVRLYLLSSIIMLFLGTQGFVSQDHDGIPIVANTEDGISFPPDTSGVSQDSLDASREAEKGLQMSFNDKTDEMADFYQSHPRMSASEALDSMDMENSWWNRFAYEQASKTADFNVDDFNEFYTSKLLWVLFFFVPLLALWLKLLYIRRGFYYLEHLFFALFTQATLFIIISVTELLDSVFALPEWFAAVVILLFAVHLFLAIKRFYGQRFWKTFFKFIVLNIGFVLLMIVFLFLSLMVVFILF